MFPERFSLPEDHRREAWAGILSALVHLGIVLVVLFVRFDSAPAQRRTELTEVRRYTPLIAPPTELTQKEPNQGRVSKEVNVEGLLPRPAVKAPPSPPPAPRRFIPPAPVPAAAPAAPSLPEPPKLDAQAKAAQLPPPGVPDPIAATPPKIQVEEKPKLAFEKPGASSGIPSGAGRLTAPKSTVDEALRSIARGGGSSGMAVGDMETITGIGETINRAPTPARNGSRLELLSDPLGVDFRPYLLRILAAVRRNWLSVVPESAKFGRTAKVVVQFAISKDGRVPKLVIATPSGTDALDRAAVAGISASNPFPPLPTEFKGDQIRVQFAFSYNAR